MPLRPFPLQYKGFLDQPKPDWRGFRRCRDRFVRHYEELGFSRVVGEDFIGDDARSPPKRSPVTEPRLATTRWWTAFLPQAAQGHPATVQVVPGTGSGFELAPGDQLRRIAQAGLVTVKPIGVLPVRARVRFVTTSGNLWGRTISSAS